MTSISVAGLDGDPVDLADSSLSAFAADLDGQLLRPDDAGYAESVSIWNGMITKRPAIVVRAASSADAARTVSFVAANGLQLSIRGGGHNIAGLALSEGGVTLDMSGLTDVSVDTDAGLARVAAGATLGDVDRATQPHGLATTLGFVSATGVAGLTLGGGFGYLSRRFGWTVDDLESVEIVTADGETRTVSRDEEAELFWALRGGGGNFGVVTEFTYRLHEVGPQMTGGIIAWPGSDAERVLEAFREAARNAPRELTLVALRRNAPPAPWLPESAHGTPIIGILACHTGELDRAAADLEPITSLGGDIANTIAVKEYTAQQSMLDATQPKGMHYYWKSEFVPELSDGLLSAYHQPFADLKAPANQMVLFQLDGALNEHAEDDGAMGNREAAFACVIQSMWAPDSPAGDSNRDWVRAAWQGIRPFSTGGNYVNFQTDDEPEERTAESYRGNFGVVTEFTYRLHEVGPQMTGGIIAW
ncbi:MAG: FAD-binding oxidoreductase, partial [Chloroflexota bacterium]|nr:FAD-binding oxidoreductase [Chloroflexota bacterium]